MILVSAKPLYFNLLVIYECIIVKIGNILDHISFIFKFDAKLEKQPEL